MSKQSISNNLRKLRFLENEMTQAELAKIVGVTRQTIISLEAGRYTPTLELALKLSTVFGKTVNDVFFWADEENATRIYRERNAKK